MHAASSVRMCTVKGTQSTWQWLVWSGEQALSLGLIDGLGNASSVARDVIGEKELVDFTVEESPFDRFSKKLGASVAEHLAMWMGFQGPSLR